MAGESKRLTYRGPAQQVCYELVPHGYSAILVPDAVYELPSDFADKLLSSSTHFQVAPVSLFVSANQVREREGFAALSGKSHSETTQEES